MSTNDELEKRLQYLEAKIEHLTTRFNKINNSGNQVVHYHINTMEIQHAQIEKLDYHLDSIGIENLSGTLNIGNNFDAKQQSATIQKATLNNDKEYEEKTRPAYRPLKKKNKQNEDGQKISVSNRKNGFSVKINATKEEK